MCPNLLWISISKNWRLNFFWKFTVFLFSRWKHMLWYSMEACQCAIVNDFFLDENIIKDLFNPKDREKNILRVYDQVRLKPACFATEIARILSFAWGKFTTNKIRKKLIRHLGCTGWYAHLLFAGNKISFSCNKTHIRPIDKSAWLKINFLISRPKHNVVGTQNNHHI